MVFVSIPQPLHKLLHEGCKLQAAYLPLPLKAPLVFQVKLSFFTLLLYSMSAAGLILKGLICRGVKAHSHAAREISEHGKTKGSLLSVCLPWIYCLSGSWSQLQVFIIPRIIVWLTETSPCRQREGSTQTDITDGSLLGTAHNTKEKAKGF